MPRYNNSKTNSNSRFNRAEVTTVTESEYEGIPMLALPGNHPKFPIQMTLPKWRKVLAHIKDVEAFVAKHAAWQPAPKEEKQQKTAPVTTPAGQVDLSKLDPALRAVVEAALKNSQPVPTLEPAPAAPDTSMADRIAALRAKMAK